MNFTLFLILLIVLIIILIFIISYNGLKIELFSKKEKEKFEIELKASILNIAIFKRQYPSIETGPLEKDDENSIKKSDGTPEDFEEDEEDRSLKEKYDEFKPILNDLKNSKQELNEFLLSVFKDTDFKKIDGYLKLGLKDYSKTAKIMGWIWSINAVANTFCEPLNLKGEPIFTEEVIDFDIHAIIKLNLLFLIFHALKLVSHENARTLIKDSIAYFRKDNKDKKLENKTNSNPTSG